MPGPPVSIGAAVLLTAGRGNEMARAFLDFLKSDAARAVLARYGYES